MTAAETSFITDIATRERPRLLGFIRKAVRDEGDAEDILQDVMYQLLIGFKDIRSVEKITSWLFTVARNRITDYYRKRKPESLSDKQIHSQKSVDDGPLMLEDIIPALSHDPEDEYMREVIWQAIEDVLEELPEQQRDVFIMNEFDGLSFREISKITGDGLNTLLSRKRYAVVYLRKKLQQIYKQL